MNGAVLSAVIILVYLIALLHYCDGEMFQEDIDKLDDYENKLMDARTVAFISLVWSENIRSYTSRSFDRPIWNNVWGNKHMQKAIILAQICLYVAVLLPGFSDMILGLRGVAVGLYGWALAIVGPVGCLILCEVCMIVTAWQKQQYQNDLALRQAAEAREPQLVRTISPCRASSSPKVQQPQAKAPKKASQAKQNKGLCRCFTLGCV